MFFNKTITIFMAIFCLCPFGYGQELAEKCPKQNEKLLGTCFDPFLNPKINQFVILNGPNENNDLLLAEKDHRKFIITCEGTQVSYEEIEGEFSTDFGRYFLRKDGTLFQIKIKKDPSLIEEVFDPSGIFLGLEMIQSEIDLPLIVKAFAKYNERPIDIGTSRFSPFFEEQLPQDRKLSLILENIENSNPAKNYFTYLYLNEEMNKETTSPYIEEKILQEFIIPIDKPFDLVGGIKKLELIKAMAKKAILRSTFGLTLNSSSFSTVLSYLEEFKLRIDSLKEDEISPNKKAALYKEITEARLAFAEVQPKIIISNKEQDISALSKAKKKLKIFKLFSELRFQEMNKEIEQMKNQSDFETELRSELLEEFGEIPPVAYTLLSSLKNPSKETRKEIHEKLSLLDTAADPELPYEDILEGLIKNKNVTEVIKNEIFDRSDYSSIVKKDLKHTKIFIFNSPFFSSKNILFFKASEDFNNPDFLNEYILKSFFEIFEKAREKKWSQQEIDKLFIQNLHIIEKLLNSKKIDLAVWLVRYLEKLGYSREVKEKIDNILSSKLVNLDPPPLILVELLYERNLRDPLEKAIDQFLKRKEYGTKLFYRFMAWKYTLTQDSKDLSLLREVLISPSHFDYIKAWQAYIKLLNLNPNLKLSYEEVYQLRKLIKTKAEFKNIATLMAASEPGHLPRQFHAQQREFLYSQLMKESDPDLRYYYLVGLIRFNPKDSRINSFIEKAFTSLNEQNLLIAIQAIIHLGNFSTKWEGSLSKLAVPTKNRLTGNFSRLGAAGVQSPEVRLMALFSLVSIFLNKKNNAYTFKASKLIGRVLQNEQNPLNMKNIFSFIFSGFQELPPKEILIKELKEHKFSWPEEHVEKIKELLKSKN